MTIYFQWTDYAPRYTRSVMEKSNSDRPAFPQRVVERILGPRGTEIYEEREEPGLTKREYFAILLMPAMLDEWVPAKAITQAVTVADALLAELSKSPNRPPESPGDVVL